MSEKIRTLIVDDEPLAREYLRNLSAQHEDVEIIGECRDGREAIEKIRRHDPALVFLDVQMPGISGVDVIEEITPQQMPLVVFVTAFDRYALHAFDVNAIDYLLKPFSEERFARTLDRVRDHLRGSRSEELTRQLVDLVRTYREAQTGGHLVSRVTGAEGETGRYIERLTIEVRDAVKVLPVAKIDWIEAADYYVKIHCEHKAYLKKASMKWLEERLDPAKFVRIHRGSIVNIERVKELQPHFHGQYEVLLHDGTRLRLSRGRRKALEQALGQSL